MEKKFVKTNELAEIISISAYVIRKYVREGIFPAYRIGGKEYLFDPEEILKVIKGHRKD